MLALIFSLGWMTNGEVHAQNNAAVRFRSLEVDFWPEYDRAEMLVIYRIELDPTVPLPVDLSIRIPAQVGMPHAVAAGQTNDSLFTITADRLVDGDWAYINFNTAMPIVRLEYYDNALDVANPSRSYQYNWHADYAVDQLLLQVQQPCEASAMQISPSLGSGVVGGDGLVYFAGTFGPLSQGQTFDLTFTYTKESDCLSIQTLDIGSDLPEDTPGRVTFVSVLPYLLGLLGVILIVGGVFWYWQSGRQRPAGRQGVGRSRRPARSHPELPDEGEITSESGALYCHNCGKRARPTDKFCRACGTRLRNT
jgi:hypothetical protein